MAEEISRCPFYGDKSKLVVYHNRDYTKTYGYLIQCSSHNHCTDYLTGDHSCPSLEEMVEKWESFPEVKGCPFCGGEARLVEGAYDGFNDDYRYKVVCTKCKGNIWTYEEDPISAIISWNKRVDSSDIRKKSNTSDDETKVAIKNIKALSFWHLRKILMDIEVLEADDIIELHNTVIDEYGGKYGLRDITALDLVAISHKDKMV